MRQLLAAFVAAFLLLGISPSWAGAKCVSPQEVRRLEVTVNQAAFIHAFSGTDAQTIWDAARKDLDLSGSAMSKVAEVDFYFYPDNTARLVGFDDRGCAGEMVDNIPPDNIKAALKAVHGDGA